MNDALVRRLKAAIGRTVDDKEIALILDRETCQFLLSALSAQPEAQAVAWYRVEEFNGQHMRVYYETQAWPDLIPLYTAPPSATIRRQAIEECAIGAMRLVSAIFDEDRGDIDGGWLQEKAVECGVLIEVEATERCVHPDDGNCACAEFGDFPMTCYRFNSAIDQALAAHPAAPVKET